MRLPVRNICWLRKPIICFRSETPADAGHPFGHVESGVRAGELKLAHHVPFLLWDAHLQIIVGIMSFGYSGSLSSSQTFKKIETEFIP